MPGAFLLKNINAGAIKLLFGAVVVLLGAEMLLRQFSKRKLKSSKVALAIVGIVAGALCGLFGIGALLAEGIGNTIRVSLTGDPVPEAKAAWDILRALNLRTHGVQLVSCPTCGRTCIDVAGIAARVEKELSDIQVPLKVAVTDCG